MDTVSACTAGVLRITSFMLCLGTLSCGTGNGAQKERHELTLTRIESRVLQEQHPEKVVARSGAITVTSDGSLYLIDQGEGRVVYFSVEGRWIGVFGKKGRGPGEFGSVPWTTMTADGTLYTNDIANRRLTAIRMRDSTILWERMLPGFVTTMHGMGNRVATSMMDPLSKTSILLLDEDPTNDVRFGPFPELFSRLPQAATVFPAMAIAAWDDTVVTAYEVSDYLYVSKLGQSAIDSIHVPPRGRRGAQHALFAAMTDDPASARAALYKSSAPFELGLIRPGVLLYVTLDQDQVNNRIMGELHATAINLTTRTSCGDTPIPVPVDPVSRIAIRGDTLLAVYQDIDSDSVSVLRATRFLITAPRCFQ